MQSIFIGRESELSKIDELFQAKCGGLFSIRGQSGSGKTFLLETLRAKYRQNAQFYLDCKQLPLIETAVEFLLHIARHGSGMKNLEEAAGLLEGNNNQKSVQAAGNPENLLLEALIKDCKLQPVIFVDAYECLLEESQIFVRKIDCNYSKFNRWQGGNKECLLYSEWLVRLLQLLRQQGALLIVAGIRLDGWQENPCELKNFSDQEIVEFAATMELNPYIDENRVAVARILSMLSFGGNPLWLRLACHFLLLELKNGKDLIQLIHVDVVEDFLSVSRTGNGAGSSEYNGCKLALLNRVMPPNQEKLWLVALSRQLDSEIFNCLFDTQGEILRYALNNFGLLAASSMGNGYKRLHSEIRELLLNYARSEGFLDSFDSKNMHRRLAALYQHRHLQQGFENNALLVEQLYHQLMAGSSADAELEHIEQPFLLVALSKALEDIGEYSRMTQVFFRLISIAPDHEQAWYSLGTTLSKQGYYREAIVAYQKQLHLVPEHEASWKNMGFAFYQIGEVEQAVNSYQKNIAIIPDHTQAWEDITTALFEKSRLQKNIDNYRQKLTENPEHETAYYNMGVAFKKLGRLEEAIDAYKRQLEINPQHDRAWNNLGTSLFLQGSYAEARMAFVKALEINPIYLYALTNDAELALVQNDVARCRKNVEAILKLVGDKTEEFVVCPFLLWLASPEKSYQPILQAIESRQPKNYFNWNFDSLETVIQRLSFPKQEIARSFISYFSNDLSYSGLQENLKNQYLS